MFRARSCLCIALVLLTVHSYAQDSLMTSFADADALFLKHNLSLLAATLHIDEQKALEIQARKYPNPTFSAEINMRDPQNNEWFHAGKSGEKALAAEQVIILSGRRRDEIELARMNSHQAELELEELLRELKLRLHTCLFSVYFDQQVAEQYDMQLQLLDTIIASYEEQTQKGNISLKELVRLKSAAIKLGNQKTELQQDLAQQQQQLSVLLNTGKNILFNPGDATWTAMERLPGLDSLETLSLASRADWKMAGLRAEQAAVNLRLQKSLAVPDISVGSAYDQRGGAFTNQVNLTLGMQLPLWNRNQGNIRSAAAVASLSEINKDQQQLELRTEVRSAWQAMLRAIAHYRNAQRLYDKDFGQVLKGITSNFRKRNISILEFVDFFESYNETTEIINTSKKQLALAAESINYVCAANIYQQ